MLQSSFDFTEDMAESALPTEHPDFDESVARCNSGNTGS
jgi:hypothetical protein